MCRTAYHLLRPVQLEQRGKKGALVPPTRVSYRSRTRNQAITAYNGVREPVLYLVISLGGTGNV